MDPEAGPPEIRTIDGETLFVSAEQRATFVEAIGDKSLKVVKRPDIWSMILEPFLDTEFTAEQKEMTLIRLTEFGMSRDEVDKARNEVEAPVLSCNWPVGQWCHLGLFDVLHAVRSSLTITSLAKRISPKRYAQFYWNAMQTADLVSNRTR